MRKENKTIVCSRFNRFISRMNQIWELWDLLRKPWDFLDDLEGCLLNQFLTENVPCISDQFTALVTAPNPLPCSGEVSQKWMLWETAKKYLCVMGRSTGIFCTPEKSPWEKQSLAVAPIWLPLPLNHSLIFYNGRCYGAAKVSQYTCCPWKYTYIAVYY